MNPKLCECGKQGSIRDSRQTPEHVQRRYFCDCGKKWWTVEMKVDHYEGADFNDTLAKKYSTVDRDAVADKLIDLAQELLR